MTASVTGSPKYSSASSFNARRTKDDSSSAVKLLSPSVNFLLLPILRLNSEAPLSGDSSICSAAVSPTYI